MEGKYVFAYSDVDRATRVVVDDRSFYKEQKKRNSARTFVGARKSSPGLLRARQRRRSLLEVGERASGGRTGGESRTLALPAWPRVSRARASFSSSLFPSLSISISVSVSIARTDTTRETIAKYKRMAERRLALPHPSTPRAPPPLPRAPPPPPLLLLLSSLPPRYYYNPPKHARRAIVTREHLHRAPSVAICIGPHLHHYSSHCTRFCV